MWPCDIFIWPCGCSSYRRSSFKSVTPHPRFIISFFFLYKKWEYLHQKNVLPLCDWDKSKIAFSSFLVCMINPPYMLAVLSISSSFFSRPSTSRPIPYSSLSQIKAFVNLVKFVASLKHTFSQVIPPPPPKKNQTKCYEGRTKVTPPQPVPRLRWGWMDTAPQEQTAKSRTSQE